MIGLGGCLAAVALALVLAVGGRGDGHAVPEGGSSFGAPPPERHHPGTGLLDALAPVLETDGGGAAAAAPAAKAATAGGAATALPASAPRAAARLFLVGFGGPDPGRDVLRRLALHEWGGVVLEAGNGMSAQQVARLVGRVRGAVQRARHVAPLIVASQPGGDGDAVPLGTPLQSQIPGAGAARATARATAKALRALGIQMVLGPDADTGTAGGPWAGRAYSDDPALVGPMAVAGVAGYQDGGVAAAPGHFPGEGAASGDPAVDQGDRRPVDRGAAGPRRQAVRGARRARAGDPAQLGDLRRLRRRDARDAAARGRHAAAQGPRLRRRRRHRRPGRRRRWPAGGRWPSSPSTR